MKSAKSLRSEKIVRTLLVRVWLTPSGGWSWICEEWRVQENEGIQIKARRKRRSREQIAELVREFKDSGLTQRKFSENRGIALSELQRSLKIVRRAGEPQLMAVQIEAAERNDRALELMVGEGYRIKIGAGFCSTTLRRLLEVLGSC